VCRFPFPSGPDPAAAVARRVDLDAALVQLARAEGVTVLEGHRVTGMDEGDDGMTLHVEGGDSLGAPYVIAADGMWSPLRKATGLWGEAGYLGEWHAFRQYWRAPGQAPNQMWVWFEPELLPGYAWSFPVGGGLANVGFGVLRRTGAGVARDRSSSSLEGRRRRLWHDQDPAGRDRWPTGQDVSRLREAVLERPHVRQVLGAGAEPDDAPRTWPIPARLSTTALAGAGGRVLFAGDAARAPDPMTGEGIAQALETGELAASAVLTAGPGHPGAAARSYRRSVQSGLVVDDRLARLLAVALRFPASARGTVRLAGSTPWVSRHFARWLFEDYPRAYLATPWRWQWGALSRHGSFE
jgi:flavin-dependent dehydrogenase